MKTKRKYATLISKLRDTRKLAGTNSVPGIDHEHTIGYDNIYS